MRILALMILGLLVVGCGKTKTETKTETQSPEEKLVGSYGNINDKLVLLENGKTEYWLNGEKKNDGTWKFEGKEVHISSQLHPNIDTMIIKIEPNGDLTIIAASKNGKRTDIPKGKQELVKKLK